MEVCKGCKGEFKKLLIHLHHPRNVSCRQVYESRRDKDDVQNSELCLSCLEVVPDLRSHLRAGERQSCRKLYEENDHNGLKLLRKAMEPVRKFHLPYIATSITPGDGSCFFHSIIDQLKNPLIGNTTRLQDVSQWTHKDLRRMVVDFMKSNEPDSDEFYKLEKDRRLQLQCKQGKTWQDMLNDYCKTDKWADFLIIYATGLYLKKSIYTTRTEYSQERPWIPSYFARSDTGLPITLAYLGDEHFQSVHPTPPSAVNSSICRFHGKMFSSGQDLLEHLEETNDPCKMFHCNSGLGAVENEADESMPVKSSATRLSMWKDLRKRNGPSVRTRLKKSPGKMRQRDQNGQSDATKRKDRSCCNPEASKMSRCRGEERQRRANNSAFGEVNQETAVTESIVSDKTKCKGCGRHFEKLKTHLNSRQTCKKHYTPQDLLDYERQRHCSKQKAYRARNASRIKKSKKEYQARNASRIKKSKKVYNMINQSRNKEQHCVYNKTHQSQIMQKQRVYNKDHQKQITERQRIYNKDHQTQITTRQRAYNKTNAETINENQNRYNAKNRLLVAKKRLIRHNNERQRLGKEKIKPTQAEKLLKEFARALGEGWSIPCCSCFRLFFKTSVNVLFEGNAKDAFTQRILRRGEKAYICSTCLGYRNKKKIPPMSRTNGLSLDDVPSCLKLSELETVLIARNILFLKIFALPKSRWGAFKDKVINVPIPSDEIITSLSEISKFPRQPSDAGLIPVMLKRKKAYKSYHLHASVSPEKLVEALHYLRDAGHPGYQQITIAEDYQISFNGLNIDLNITNDDQPQVNDQDKLELPGDVTMESSDTGSNNEEKSEDSDDNQLPSVKKTQSEVTQSTMMTNSFPEALCHTKSNGSVPVAPGEGRIPTNLMREKDWDIMAFPTWFPSGKFGIDYERKIKLTKQQYFIQRLENVDPRFRNDDVYVFSATNYIERLQMEQASKNIHKISSGHLFLPFQLLNLACKEVYNIKK